MVELGSGLLLDEALPLLDDFQTKVVLVAARNSILVAHNPLIRALACSYSAVSFAT